MLTINYNKHMNKYLMPERKNWSKSKEDRFLDLYQNFRGENVKNKLSLSDLGLLFAEPVYEAYGNESGVQTYVESGFYRPLSKQRIHRKAKRLIEKRQQVDK